MRWRRSAEPLHPAELGAGLALRGPLWLNAQVQYDDGVVVIDADGLITAAGPAATTQVPADVETLAANWIGPGLVDHHVHLSFGNPDHIVARGVVAVRDLGAPPTDALAYRRLAAPRVAVAGPLLTAPGGYPSRGWGEAGFAAFVDDPEQASRLVSGLATQVDVIKLALEAAGGPVPSADVARAVVTAAHTAGVEVTCHALTVDMVERALDAGVDELAHTPTEPLPAEIVERIAWAGVRVVSTLHTFVAGRDGAGALDNAAALVAARVDVRYGTDLGNAGVKPGADPAELKLLGQAGLRPDAVLAAATEPVRVGVPAGLVALDADPREHVEAWREPLAVVVGGTLLIRHPAT
jgi:imidazolonepropionase-like amidohydrolase